MVRHLVSADNVTQEGFVIDPKQIRHGVIRGGRIAALSGEIDPLTHLNLDFPSHKADLCVVAAELVVGSPVEWLEDGLRFAQVPPQSYQHLGPVAVDERRIKWLHALEERRKKKVGKSQ